LTDGLGGLAAVVVFVNEQVTTLAEGGQVVGMVVG